MRLHVAHPERHEAIVDLPWRLPLADWSMPNVHRVLGLHRHVVKLLEYDRMSYVVKELPDELAERSTGSSAPSTTTICRPWRR